ncbi:MAG: TolC family protein [Verrucomicrobia bacterium]|nr:TolC family protein [Verrucomicrobiota bacterium]MDA1087177.1 TolC family protein [Verrucomicrobiota bacterium]
MGFRLGLAACMLPVLQGCMSSGTVDRNVSRAVEKRARGSNAIRPNSVEDAFRPSGAAPRQQGVVELDLNGVLEMATQYSRRLQGRRETLYLAGLTQLSQARAFGVQLSGTLSYVNTISGVRDGDGNASAEASATHVLPTGANIALQGSTTRRDSNGTTNDVNEVRYNSSLSLRLTQPLLAGAGYEVSHDARIQAERDLLYALREFALERQDFAIRTVEQYYGLLNQQSVLRNTRLNVEQSIFLRKRSEALFDIRMATAIDVLRSQQQELTALNQVESAEADFDVALKRFLIALGLPVELELNILGQFPEAFAVELDESACIDLALQMRLDLSTVRDRVEDSRRRLRIAKNAVLPRLDGFTEATYSGESDKSFGGESFEDSVAAGVTFEVPLDKRDERDAVKRTEMGVTAAERELEQTLDTVKVEIIENFRRLNSLRITVDIQAKNMEIAEKRARNALLRFKNGELSNRDVVEAENDLLDARNSYARALVDHELQRLRLLRNVGLLDVAPDGTMLELSIDDVQR